MSAPYTLPGDVVELKGIVVLWSPSGEVTRLSSGYYGLVSQSGEMLTLIPLREDETGATVAHGEPITVSVSFLDLSAVGTTNLNFILYYPEVL